MIVELEVHSYTETEIYNINDKNIERITYSYETSGIEYYIYYSNKERKKLSGNFNFIETTIEE